MPKVIFQSAADQSQKICEAASGETVLEIAQANNIDIEGACEGQMACSTCHVIVDAEYFSRLPAASEEEEDMLDLTYGLRANSRLGCQLVMTDELDGLLLYLPDQTVNMS